MNKTVVIHGCAIGEELEILAMGEKVVCYPPARMGPDAQDTFVEFGIEWNNGMSSRRGFLVKLPRNQGTDTQHFDLVFDSKNPRPARVGLRPWSNGKPNPAANILWARQDVEPKDWVH